MSSFQSAGGGGVPVSASLTGPSNPSISNQVIALANTEQSYTLPLNSKRVLVISHGKEVKLAYTSGDSGTNYVTVPRYGFYAETDISSASLTLYFQSVQAGLRVEIISWA